MLCTTIKNDDFNILYSSAQKYPFIELRIDDSNLTEEEITRIIAIKGNEKIFTIRNQSKSNESKLYDFIIASDQHCEYFDVEFDFPYLDNFCKLAKSINSKLILSYHNLNYLPSVAELENLANTAHKLKADYLKIACQCNNTQEYLDLINLYSNPLITKLFPKKLIALPIGTKWKLHRLSLLELGCPFVYVCEDDKPPVADGQIPFSVANKILNLIQ